MTRRSVLTLMLAAAMAALLSATPRVASAAGREDELKQRLEQRNPQIQAAKDAGKIGETFEGFVDAVKGGLDNATQKLIDDENADRREVYDLIAKRTNAQAAQVARASAQRKFKIASAGHWLKHEDGQWRQKK